MPSELPESLEPPLNLSEGSATEKQSEAETAKKKKRKRKHKRRKKKGTEEGDQAATAAPEEGVQSEEDFEADLQRFQRVLAEIEERSKLCGERIKPNVEEAWLEGLRCRLVSS